MSIYFYFDSLRHFMMQNHYIWSENINFTPIHWAESKWSIFHPRIEYPMVGFLLVASSSWYTVITIMWFFGSFGLSTKEPYFFMNCPSSLVSLVLVSSVHTSPWHRVRHRNVIFGMHMHTCPPHIHIKYLVILTCRF